MCWEGVRPGWRDTAHTAVPGTQPWLCSPGGEATGLRAAASHGLYHEGVRELLKSTLFLLVNFVHLLRQLLEDTGLLSSHECRLCTSVVFISSGMY